GRLFRADFSGANSGTSQDDERIYLVNVDETSDHNLVLRSGKLDSAADDFITLGTLSNGVGCDGTELTAKIAHTSSVNQFALLRCTSLTSDGFEDTYTTGLFTFKPDQENSLSSVQDFLSSDEGDIRPYW